MEKVNDKSFKSKFKALVPYIIIVVVVVLIRTFIVTPGIVNGSSMETTLHDGDFVLVNKIGLLSGIERFDIVVVKYNEGSIIKRVIGLPGETVKYADNILYINGEEVDTPIEFQNTDDFTIKAKEGEYIVLGDNRNNSTDSRLFGPVEKSSIKGKVDLIFYPFSDAGKIK